jgi:hypothetical protein
MAAKTDLLEDEVLNRYLRFTTALTPVATVYVALYTTATTDAGGGTEVTGGSYARTAVTFGAPSSNTVANSGVVTFPTASASWGTITHMAILDASTLGNMLYHGPLAASKTVDSGDTVSFAASALTVSEA